jgi:hypothetical protein
MARPFVPLLAALTAVWLPLPAAGQSPLSAEQLRKIKAATVFVKVRAGGTLATGSGFLVRADGPAGYVVTNNHVIDPADGDAPAGMAKPAIEVVFDSGTAKERAAAASVAAADPLTDLAVLKVTGVKDLPAPLDLADPPQLLETMPVFVCGFPFGGRLALGEKNPEISIGTASVSSIRHNDLGQVAAVELNGVLNPGNSGGPVVSDKGKLVGVAVSTVRGAGIGRAIPQQQVASMLRGRVGPIRLVPAGAGKARLEVGVIDPLRRVTAVVAHHKPGGGEVPAMKADAPAVMPGATKLPLTLDPETMTAAGELPLPAPKTATLVVQVEMTVPDGKLLTVPGTVTASDPRAPAAGGLAGRRQIRLPSGQVLPMPSFRRPPGAEDQTLSDLIRDPAAFVGKAVTFDALTNCSVLPQGDRFELQIETDAERAPTNLRPVVPKDLAFQLVDLGFSILPYKFTVRLRGTVQKPAGRDDRHLIEVTEVGFLDDAGAARTTLKPEGGPPAGPPTLSALNRFPEQFVGKAVTVDGIVKGAKFAGRGLGVDVQNENGATPLNLAFFAAKDLHNQLASEVPGGGAAARLTVTVDRVDAKTGQGVVGVSKVELQDVGPKPRTLAGSGPIAYPTTPAAAAKPKTPAADAATPGEPAPLPPPAAAAGGKGGGSVLAYVLFGVAAVAGLAGATLMLRKKPPPPARYGGKPAVEPAHRPAANQPRPGDFPGFDFERRG